LYLRRDEPGLPLSKPDGKIKKLVRKLFHQTRNLNGRTGFFFFFAFYDLFFKSLIKIERKTLSFYLSKVPEFI